jgi:hypothetical protein
MELVVNELVIGFYWPLFIEWRLLNSLGTSLYRFGVVLLVWEYRIHLIP